MLKLVFHERFLERYPTGAVETPARVRAIYNRLKGSYEVVSPEPAAKEDILRAHDPEHLIQVQLEGRLVWRAAFLAAGGAVCAATHAVRGFPCFAAVRPPGHHAGRRRFAGFCFFNNMAVAILHLLENGLAESAAVVDFDMHRGDGTLEILGEDPRVQMVDVSSADRSHFLDRLSGLVQALDPVDVIGVSAGFDMHVRDWGNLLTDADYHRIGRLLGEVAAEKSRGRVFAVLEGGYAAHVLGRAVFAFCRGLEGFPLDSRGDGGC